MQAARVVLLLPFLLAAEPGRDCREPPRKGEAVRCAEHVPAIPEAWPERVEVAECLCTLRLADGSTPRARTGLGAGYWLSSGFARNTSAWREWRIRRIAELEAHVKQLEARSCP
jgi:hypothetical protein